MAGAADEEMRILEHKMKTLKLDYERYFLGTRPREPVQARQEVQKMMAIWANQPIPNTALRFKFNSINSRYQAMKRQWDNILRQMEAGTYKRDIFKANIRSGAPPDTSKKTGPGNEGVKSTQAGSKLFDSYRDAAQACGQNVKGLTAKKLQSVVDKQTAALRKKMNCKDVNFRVTVQDGKVKLKASPIRE